ncbi:AAA family ATPase [Lactobacillus sp. S2-2]|uniref:RNA polymerase recycling motor HelD n=1 Tax=Lactobacillus sp. S2-2 TaxID=2692917 RepID=UPI001F3C0BB5|nr:RNA polymerase recycling motor HelD [Lactobacillus sp. S2-2]MCF6515842.1 AAA family ATPase [Lactobacillus sp. S2-2]
MNNSEKSIEINRVEEIIKKLDHKIELTKEEYKKAKDEVTRVQKNYSNNTSINYFEVDDRIETSADLQQQRGLVNKVVEDEAIVKRQLATYEELKSSPYFGRIDVIEENEKEALYIGIASFIDEKGQFLIHDWRAPISSIYYNGKLGNVSYQTPRGKQNVELTKKRQYQIKNGDIINMFDTNETVGDEMLQQALGDQNTQTMRNIVATIQNEQNDIIRDTKTDLLVVQGVAGSGKTSTILQRIAFLLYHSRDSLDADQIILFSPNLLFSHYISEVLPSLGEKNMRQVTLSEFLSHRLTGLNVQSIFSKYEENQVEKSDNEIITNFKNSQSFIDQINEYLQNLNYFDIQFNSILFRGQKYFDKHEIATIYQELPKDLKFDEKMLQTKNILIKKLKENIERNTEAEWIENEIENLSNEEYNELLGEDNINEELEFDEIHQIIAENIAKRELTSIYDAIYNNNLFDPYSQYIDFLKNISLPKEISKSQWDKSIQVFENNLEFHNINFEDTAPFIYLRDKFTGSGRNHSIQYLFIDEIQDYSISQIMYLKYAFPNAKFNLIGDSEQNIFSEVESADQLLKNLDNAISSKHARLISLNRSYRSTYPITNFAKNLLPHGEHIQPFNREGEIPKLYLSKNNEQMLNTLKKVIIDKQKEQETIAIITKSLTEAKELQKKLHREFNSILLTDEDRILPEKVIILPIYLAKGLEFDCIIGYNISKSNFTDLKSVGILYTIATRAMHDLTLISETEFSPLINQKIINEKLIQIKRTDN